VPLPWKKLPGVPIGPTGQPASDYVFTLPADVPDGVIDVEAVAIDDLGISASSKVTVTKGTPCATADTCLKGQQCSAGKCFWDPPTGATGEGERHQGFLGWPAAIFSRITRPTFCSSPKRVR